MRRFLPGILIALLLACTGPVAPAPGGDATPSTPRATVGATAPPASPASEPATARSAPAATPTVEAIAGQPTTAEPTASAEPAAPPATSALAEPTPAAGGGVVQSEAEGEALAMAPPAGATTPAPGTPTPVALPPSARLARGLTPTPDVLASSPALAARDTSAGRVDYARAIGLVKDLRKGAGQARLEERIDTAIGAAQNGGNQIEVEGWEAVLKGNTETYAVTFALRQNRQGIRAEWEVNVVTGEVRPINTTAEALDGL